MLFLLNKNLIWAQEFLLNMFFYSFIIIPAAFLINYIQKKYKNNPGDAPYILKIFALDHYGILKQGNSVNSDIIYEQLLPSEYGYKLKLSSEKFSLCNLFKKYFCDSYYGSLFFCFVGLQIVFLTWGIVQEKIITKPYCRKIEFQPESGGINNINLKNCIYDNFTDSQFLVFTNKLSGFFLAGIWLLFWSHLKLWKYCFTSKTRKYNNHSSPTTPIKYPALYRYSYASLSNIMSSWCQYEALKFVSFPTQVLFKSGKIIPVMIISKLLAKNRKKKQYPITDYICAGLVSIGIGMFLISRHGTTKEIYSTKSIISNPYSRVSNSYNPDDLSAYNEVNHSSSTSEDGMINWLIKFGATFSGIILLIGYVIFDSFTSNWQSELFDRYNKTYQDDKSKLTSPHDDDYVDVVNPNCKHSNGAVIHCNGHTTPNTSNTLLNKDATSKLNGNILVNSSKSRTTSTNTPDKVGSDQDVSVAISSWDMMCYVNLFSSLFTGVSLILRDFKNFTIDPAGGTNGLMKSITFARDHDRAFLFDMFTLSLCSALGQIFIFLTISKFGAVTFVTTMTVRQGFAVWLSCLVYGHEINGTGMLGILLVFLALFAKIYLGSPRRTQSLQFIRNNLKSRIRLLIGKFKRNRHGIVAVC